MNKDYLKQSIKRLEFEIKDLQEQEFYVQEKFYNTSDRKFEELLDILEQKEEVLLSQMDEYLNILENPNYK